MSINANLNALRAVRRLDEAGSARGRTSERLSTGSRINHASDDAAGLAVASSLNLESRVNSQAVRNVSDGASFLNVADGAAKELKNILFRLRELAAQSSNGAFSNVQRASLDKEAQALKSEYNRVLETAKFNGRSVFGGPVSVQAGAGLDAVLVVGAVTAGAVATLVGDGTFKARQSFTAGASPYSFTTGDFNGDGVLDLVTADYDGTASILLGNGNPTAVSPLTALNGVSVATQGAALAAQGRIDDYLDEVNSVSGSIGVGLSRLAVASAHLKSNVEATKAAEARITDVDAAEESARLVSTGILQQAAAAVLAHALKGPESALKLLQA